MSDVVLRFPLADAREVEAFGAYVSAFVESRALEAERAADWCDAPYLMIRTEPDLRAETKVITFQERDAAHAFSTGWSTPDRAAWA